MIRQEQERAVFAQAIDMPGPPASRLAATILAVSLFVLALVNCGLAQSESEFDLGPQKMVISPGKFGLRCFPDVAISVLSSQPLAFYVVNTSRTELLEGPTFEMATPTKVVLEPAGGTAFDSSYAGVSAVYQWRPKRELLAFYHAEDSSGMEKNQHNSLIVDAHWSIGLAVSRDGGRTLERAGQILTSRQAKDAKHGISQGLGDVAVCEDSNSEFLLAYYTDLSLMPREPARICVARSRIRDGGRPKTWKKFHNGEFSEDGLGGLESTVIPDACNPTVSYVKAINKYLMFFTVADWPEHQQGRADRSGFYWSVSDDGLAWSEPKKLFSALTVPLVGKEFAAHPFFHLQKATQASVSGWLFYAYTPHFGVGPDGEHFLVKRSVQLRMLKRDDKRPEPAGEPSAFEFKNKGYIATPVKRFSPVTLEAWVRPKENPKDTFVVGSMTTAQGIGLGLNGGVLRAQFLVGDIGSVGRAPTDRWSHIAGVYGDDGTRLYLNGKQVGKGPANIEATESPKFVVGAIGDGLLEHCFEGLVKSVRISKGARYHEDFIPDKVFRADPKTSPVPAVLIYDASRTQPHEATDLSGFGNHGELFGVGIQAVHEAKP